MKARVLLINSWERGVVVRRVWEGDFEERSAIKLARNMEKRLHVDLIDTLQISEGDLSRKQLRSAYRFQVFY